MSWTPCGKSVTACIHVMYWMSQHVLLGKWHQRKHTINFSHLLHWSPPTILQNAHFNQIRWAIPSCWHPMVIGTLYLRRLMPSHHHHQSSVIHHSSSISCHEPSRFPAHFSWVLRHCYPCRSLSAPAPLWSNDVRPPHGPAPGWLGWDDPTLHNLTMAIFAWRCQFTRR